MYSVYYLALSLSFGVVVLGFLLWSCSFFCAVSAAFNFLALSLSSRLSFARALCFCLSAFCFCFRFASMACFCFVLSATCLLGRLPGVADGFVVFTCCTAACFPDSGSSLLPMFNVFICGDGGSGPSVFLGCFCVGLVTNTIAAGWVRGLGWAGGVGKGKGTGVLISIGCTFG